MQSHDVNALLKAIASASPSFKEVVVRATDGDTHSQDVIAEVRQRLSEECTVHMHRARALVADLHARGTIQREKLHFSEIVDRICKLYEPREPDQTPRITGDPLKATREEFLAATEYPSMVELVAHNRRRAIDLFPGFFREGRHDDPAFVAALERHRETQRLERERIMRQTEYGRRLLARRAGAA